MASKSEIATLAISHLGVGKLISDIETERGSEADAVRTFYDIARRQTLTKFAWPFATKFADLALVEEEPTSEWRYSYRYPSDCLSIRRLFSGARTDCRGSRVKYKIGKDATARLIYTDKQDAEIEYTENIEDTAFFTDDFCMALSALIAHYIAPKINNGDPQKFGDKMFKLYMLQISQAAANAFNEQTLDEEPDSELILTRDA